MTKKTEIENLKKTMAEMAKKLELLEQQEAKATKKPAKKTVKKQKKEKLNLDIFDVSDDEKVEQRIIEFKAKEEKEQSKIIDNSINPDYIEDIKKAMKKDIERRKAEANKINKEAEAKKARQQAITKKIIATKKAKREAKLKRKEMSIIKKAEQILIILRLFVINILIQKKTYQRIKDF